MAAKEIFTESVNENITRINLKFVSMYAVNDNSNTICVDTGLNTEGVKEAFNKLKINPEDIEAVFLTHSDGDHTGGISVFPGAKVFISSEEEQMINGKTARFLKLIHNKKPECTLTFLKDGDDLNVGNISLKCISTPGHTPGSMSFLINDKYLFVGDILNIKNGRVVMDRSFLQMNKEMQKNSIKKLAKLEGIDLLLTAHTGFTNKFENAMSDWK